MGAIVAKGVYPVIVAMVVSVGVVLFMFKAMWMLLSLAAEHLWRTYAPRL